jgi:hypothetical protein
MQHVTLPFHKEFLLPTLIFSLSLIDVKTGRSSLKTVEVIEAESQAVLNTLTEH